MEMARDLNKEGAGRQLQTEAPNQGASRYGICTCVAETPQGRVSCDLAEPWATHSKSQALSGQGKASDIIGTGSDLTCPSHMGSPTNCLLMSTQLIEWYVR